MFDWRFILAARFRFWSNFVQSSSTVMLLCSLTDLHLIESWNGPKISFKRNSSNEEKSKWRWLSIWRSIKCGGGWNIPTQALFSKLKHSLTIFPSLFSKFKQSRSFSPYLFSKFKHSLSIFRSLFYKVKYLLSIFYNLS